MGKFCKSCLKTVEDESRKFCPYCGEPLDEDLKLAMDLDKAVRSSQVAEPSGIRRQEPAPMQRRAGKSRYDDDDYIPPVRKKEEKSSSSTGIVIAVIVVIVIAAAYFMFFK